MPKYFSGMKSHPDSVRVYKNMVVVFFFAVSKTNQAE